MLRETLTFSCFPKFTDHPLFFLDLSIENTQVVCTVSLEAYMVKFSNKGTKHNSAQHSSRRPVEGFHLGCYNGGESTRDHQKTKNEIHAIPVTNGDTLIATVIYGIRPLRCICIPQQRYFRQAHLHRRHLERVQLRDGVELGARLLVAKDVHGIALQAEHRRPPPFLLLIVHLQTQGTQDELNGMSVGCQSCNGFAAISSCG